MEKKKIYKSKIIIDNRELEENKRDVGKEKKKLMIVSGIIAIIAYIVVLLTLPLTILSWSGLFVYASIVLFLIFLFILMFRYFSILIMAYLYITRYTVKDESNQYTPFVSIIVPVYNEGLVLKNSIESLLKLNYSNYEIIIVNDGSKDNTAEVGQALVGYHQGVNARVKVSLINKPNGGKSKALNAGIRHSKADFVLCMDGDSQLTEDTLRMGIRHFANPEIGAVAGNVKVLNRKKFYTDLQALEYIEGLNLPRSAQGLINMVNIIPGPIGIFRRQAIEDAGFYTTDTFAEDADLTLKILSAGWRIHYEPNSIAITEAPEKLHQLLKQRYRWTRGILQAINKHKRYIYNPTINFNNTLILWSMSYEAIVWPFMNLLANINFILVAIFAGMSSLVFFFWIGIAILDMMSALYAVAVEKEDFRLIPYALVYRIFFVVIIDVTKAMASIEEFLGFEMSWGKLERIGEAQVSK